MMKKVHKSLNYIFAILLVFIGLWIFTSWVDVVWNNLGSCEYGKFNFFVVMYNTFKGVN